MRLHLSTAGDGIKKTVLEVIDKGTYNLHRELWTLPFDGAEVTETTQAYTKDGVYIGDERTAKLLCDKRGIVPELSERQHSVASIGKSTKDGKWYGWSHRAIYGFEPGSTCKEGDCHYTPEKGEWTAETEEDARQMAIDFAQSVSNSVSESSSGLARYLFSLSENLLPSAHALGADVTVLIGLAKVPAVILAITFMPGKVLYTVAVYTGHTQTEFYDEYGLVNSIGYDRDGREFIRIHNLDSTFVQ